MAFPLTISGPGLTVDSLFQDCRLVFINGQSFKDQKEVVKSKFKMDGAHQQGLFGLSIIWEKELESRGAKDKEIL